ncbi:hypothetical protein Tco_1413235 [Tanacetum coccineum]
MEGLHVALSDSVLNGRIRGINIGSSDINLSLKISIHKSSIYGIGVSSEDVHLMASITGCSAGSFPFNYLGLPIGSNMSFTSNWKLLVDKFHSKLSSWKANLLSYGGHLKLIISILGELFRLERDKDCLVTHLISNGQWAWNWSRSILGVRNSTYLNNMLAEISQIEVSEDMDKCTWSLAHDEMFFVGALRRLIDDHTFPSLDTKTAWDKSLPRKVNIFM